MESILSVLLFSLSSNLDNVVIGIAYGIKNIKIRIISNLIIAIITCAGTFLSMLFGTLISNFLPHSVANNLGVAAIMILALYFVIQSIIKLKNNTNSKELALKSMDNMIEYAEESDLDHSGDINIKEAAFVALGLTFNNLGTGIAASVTGVSIYFTVIATFILSIVTIMFGQTIGNHILGKFLGKYASLISGILLAILGIIEFFN